MELFNVYPLFNVSIVRGKGCYIYDDKNNEYLDLYGGHAVISVGHCHPTYVKAIQDQVAKLGFYSNSVKNPLQKEFARRLGKISGYDDYKLFLINSGAEANENALKLASFYNGRTKVVSVKKSFHGRTAAAVKVADNAKIVAPINDNIDVTRVELNDIEEMKKALAPKDKCAFVIEGISGVGGIHIPSAEYMKALREECTKTGTILILDEIQSGYGRSGKFFAHQYSDIKADLISVAKGICNGLPMSGLLINPMFEEVYGRLGTTFGGNHLACAGAIAVLDIIEKENLIENAKTLGAYLKSELEKIEDPRIIEIRGRGLMVGIEFNCSMKPIREDLIYKKHIFTGASGANVLRILPPLVINKEQIDVFLEKFKETLKEIK